MRAPLASGLCKVTILPEKEATIGSADAKGGDAQRASAKNDEVKKERARSTGRMVESSGIRFLESLQGSLYRADRAPYIEPIGLTDAVATML